MSTTSPFSCFDNSIDNVIEQVKTHQVEAYQIVQLKKQTVGNKIVRVVVDTIKVNYGGENAARKSAIIRSKQIKNSFVIEKCEKLITDMPNEDDL